MLAVVSAPMAAQAQSPVDLGGKYVVDTVNAVGSRGAEITAATDALYARTKLQLFVVYVDSFTGVSDKTAWASSVATKNGLGDNDILLAVATVDRNYSMYYGSSAPDSATTDAIETDDIIPALKRNDWVGAAVAAAKGYAGQATDGSTTNSGGGGAPDSGSAVGTGGGSALPVVLVLVLLALVALGIVFFVRSRRTRGPGGAASVPAGPTQEQLDQKAGSLLVQLDDSLKTSEQELGFAVAQFGTEVTSPFRASLATAKSQVAEAFSLRQQLDDAVPETPEQKHTMTARIIELCEAADTELDAQADAFDDLRRLEQTAPQALAAVVTDAEAVKARLATASATVTRLQASYSPAALSSIADNPAQVQELLTFVGTAGSTAQTAIASGDASVAAINVRAAQASIGQTIRLLDAIDTLAASLGDARAKLDAAIADTQQDLATAHALPASAAGSLAESTAAEAALTAATTGEGAGNPLASLASLGAANAALDRVLDAVRDEQQKLQSATTRLPTAMSTASGQISAANDFITTRRGGVGSTARTRVAEATRHLETAVGLAQSNPIQALAEANAAQALASQALSLAQNDVDASGGLGGGQGGSFGGGLSGAILGGIIGGLLSGGGGRGNGGGMFGGGGFGGSSRSSGGGFGGGGGSRSSGGRF